MSARRARSLAFGVLLATAGWSGEGFADPPKVLVLPYQHLNRGMPDDLGEQTTVVVAKELEQQGVTVERSDDAGTVKAPRASGAKKDVPTGDPAAGEKAEALVVKAKEAMEDSEFTRAVKSLKKAVKLLEKNADAVPDLRLLSEAYLQLGVAYFRDGLEDEGDDMLNKAVHLDPTRTLADADYPPIFIRVHERARFNVLRRPRAQLEVRAASGSAVFFDGRNLGKAPIMLRDALPGEHWIRVERPGEPPLVKRVRAKSKQTILVKFEGAENAASDAPAPTGVLGAIAANAMKKAHLAQLKKAGARAGAKFVMFGGIYKTDTAYNIRSALLSTKSGKVARLSEIAFDLDMLSAEIEVFKLAEDAKKQTTDGLENPDLPDDFKIASDFTARKRRRAVKSGRETRMATVDAAPPPLKAPSNLYAESKDVGGSGRGPLVGSGEGEDSGREVARAPSPLPKDEIDPAAEERRRAKTLVTRPIIKDERIDDGEGGAGWLVWTLLGAAVVGGAAAGGYFLLSDSGSASEGTLRINW